jgi:DNA-binding transcriptional LysR family regulator
MKSLHRQIEIFEAIARLGSVTAAADELKTSQPTASRYLAELELFLGFELFHRRAGRLVPTREAGYLLQEVESSYRSVRDILADVVRLHESGLRTLRVAAVPSISLDVLPAAIAALIGRHRMLHVSLDVVPSATVLNLVARESYDIGFAIAPANIAGVRSKSLVQTEALCVLPEGRAGSLGDEVTPRELTDIPFISLGQGYLSRRQIDESFSRSHVQRRQVLETQNGAAACAAVRHGIGATITDPFAAWQFRGEGVAIRRFRPKIVIEYLVVRQETGHLRDLPAELEGEVRRELTLPGKPYAPFVSFD